MASAALKVGKHTAIYENNSAVDLTALKGLGNQLDPSNPVRTLLATLPRQMSTGEYAALVPTLWTLAERP